MCRSGMSNLAGFQIPFNTIDFNIGYSGGKSRRGKVAHPSYLHNYQSFIILDCTFLEQFSMLISAVQTASFYDALLLR